MKQTAIVWFRNDLRLHDHEPLVRAIADGYQILPVFIWEDRWQHQSPNGFLRMGFHRRRFLSESVHDLKRGLTKLNSNLMYVSGSPVRVLTDLISQYRVSALYFYRSPLHEEQADEQALIDSLGSTLSICRFWGQSLIHPNDLPVPPDQLPDQYTAFRELVLGKVPIRQMEEMPSAIPTIDTPYWGFIPESRTAARTRLTGGMTAACHRVDDWVWRGDYLKSYKETRNGLTGMDYSSKFSPWMALGCLSARQIEFTISRYEKERGENDSTRWMRYELLWRDFFFFMAMKHQTRLFRLTGLKNRPVKPDPNPELLTSWVTGNTGIPLIDSAMRELAATGYMSNRMRQVTASFLIHDLKQDWRAGAEWFEAQLIDYDACSNYGNWQYIAGVGNDPRPDRVFNVMKQAREYDSKGEFVFKWIPEARHLEGSMIHDPASWKLIPNYPPPVVEIAE